MAVLPTVETSRPPARDAGRVRSAGLDAVRILAVVAVVIGHTRTEHTATMLTFSWHVPVFFVLSGYLLSARRDAAAELSRRTQTILVPTLLWGALVTAVWCLKAVHDGTPLGHPFFKRLLWGGLKLGYPYSPFWFMPVLVVAVVLVRLLDASHRWAALAVGVGGYLLCVAYPGPVASSFWSLLLAPACVLFVLAGRALKRWRQRIRAPFVVGLALLAISGVALWLGVDRVNIKAGYFGTPIASSLNAVLISAGLILVAEALFSRVPPHAALGRFVSLLAATSMPVILAHMLVMSSWAQPWTWPEIAGTIAGLWVLGVLLSRSRTASRYLL